MENDFFKDVGQNRLENINGTVVFQTNFLSSAGFFNSRLTMAVFRSRGSVPVLRDVLMMFVMVGKGMSRFS